MSNRPLWKGRKAVERLCQDCRERYPEHRMMLDHTCGKHYFCWPSCHENALWKMRELAMPPDPLPKRSALPSGEGKQDWSG